MDAHSFLRGFMAVAIFSTISSTGCLSSHVNANANTKTISEIRKELSSDMDISTTSGISKVDFVYALEHCKYDQNGVLRNNAEVIWDMCQKHSLNEWVFCGIIATESGWCTSSLSIKKHNIMSIYKGGGYAYFESYAECIKYSANLLDEYYIQEGSTYDTGGCLLDIAETYVGTSDYSDWADMVAECAEMCTESLTR